MRTQLLLLCLAVTISSCYHVYYAPNTANAPLLKEKGETRVNALYCSGSDSEYGGLELQAATAVSKNLGVMANFFTAGRTDEVYNYSTDQYHTEKGNGTYGELGAGYFHPLDNPRWIGEIYGGTGFGSVKNEYGGQNFSKVGIFKFFVQPAIGYKVKNFEFAIVPKVSYVNWKVKDSLLNSPGNENYRPGLDHINRKKDFLAFEPALLLRAGGSDLKIQGALSFCGKNKYNGESLVESLNASIGISLNFKPEKK